MKNMGTNIQNDWSAQRIVTDSGFFKADKSLELENLDRWLIGITIPSFSPKNIAIEHTLCLPEIVQYLFIYLFLETIKLLNLTFKSK